MYMRPAFDGKASNEGDWPGDIFGRDGTIIISNVEMAAMVHMPVPELPAAWQQRDCLVFPFVSFCSLLPVPTNVYGRATMHCSDPVYARVGGNIFRADVQHLSDVWKLSDVQHLSGCVKVVRAPCPVQGIARWVHTSPAALMAGHRGIASKGGFGI